MSRKKLLWQVFPFYLIIIIASLVSAALFASREMRLTYEEEITKRLAGVAQLTIYQLPTDFSDDNMVTIDALSKASGKNSGTRITVVDIKGKVLGDSDSNPDLLENHRNRPEFAQALNGKVARTVRFSNTIQQNLIYVAIPIERHGQILGAVRASVPQTTVNDSVSAFNRKMIWGGLVIIFLATLISLLIFKKLKKPLWDLKEGAERFARGEFSRRIAVPNSEEIGALADSMNLMAEQLNERISTIVRQRNEQQALLSSMIEGVLAVNANERIININSAAARLFELEPEKALKKSVYETIRHAELHDFVSSTLTNANPIEKEISIPSNPERILQLNGSVMRDADGRRVGAVIVLNDVTRLKKLENIRRDFVANVSHELKTPITSITGFVETLLDGAIDNPDEAKRFLNIIVKQADRLNSIVDDLLTLSRIEKEFEKNEIELKPLALWEVLSSAVQACEPAAKIKDIRINLDGDKEMVANINKRQLEQAIINLIDNAIKYSSSHSQVQVHAGSQNSEIKISVLDHGSGIERKHLPRIFERFYRVDKARSREVGGTGLGLSIVKHIAIAHGGRVGVESTPGKGSSFTIYLPG